MNRKKIMAICDTEAAYACRLMEYMDEKHSLPYEIHAFTSTESLCDFAAARDVDILLVTEAALDEQVEGLPVKRRVILTENETRRTEDELFLCKYQSAGTILEQVTAFGPDTPAMPESLPSVSGRIYGVYAPCGGSRATLFAAALAAVLSERAETVYLNLRNYSGLEYLTGEIFDRTVSDLLYYRRRGAADLASRARDIAQRAGRVSFVPPPSSPADLQEVSGAEWREILSLLMNGERWTACVLELSDGVRDLPELLGVCERIFLPTGDDPIERAAREQFRETLRDTGRADLLARCVPVHLPVSLMAEEGEFFRSAAEGAAGICARRALAEERRFDDGTVTGTARKTDGPLGRMRRIIRRRDPSPD